VDGSDESIATCTNYDCTIGTGRSRCPSGVGCVDHFALCDGIPGNGLSCKEDFALCDIILGSGVSCEEDVALCDGILGNLLSCKDILRCVTSSLEISFHVRTFCTVRRHPGKWSLM
jgi:hypothetical protein